MNTTIHSLHHRPGSRSKLVAGAAVLLLTLCCTLQAADSRSLRTGPDGRPIGSGSSAEVSKTENKSNDSSPGSAGDTLRKLMEKQIRLIKARLGIP